MGRRHGRHALRAISRPGRAARRLRQARRLRDDPSAHPRDADLLAPLPLGQGRRHPGARRAGEGAWAGLRRRQLEHIPGPAGAEALLQVRFAQPQRQGRARSGDRAQPRMHRDRAEARVEGAVGLDRRRIELPGPVEPYPCLRLVSQVAGRDLCSPARRLAGVRRAQAVRAGLLFDGDLGLGHEPDGGSGVGTEGRSVSSISATMLRPSMSSRSWRG